MLDSNRLHVSTDVGNSVLFNYKTSDSIVLQLKGEVCVYLINLNTTVILNENYGMRGWDWVKWLKYL